MKIAFVQDATFPFSKGGGEKRLFEIAKRMAEKGHEVHVFGMFPKIAAAKRLKIEGDVNKYGMHYHMISEYDSLFAGERRSIFQAAKFAWKLFWKLRRYDFDVIDNFQSPILSAFAVKLAKKKAKFILSWFEIWNKKIDGVSYWIKYAGPIVGRVGMLLEWLALRLPDKIIVPSEQTKQDVIASGVTKSLNIVHNGINYEMIKKAKPFKKKYDLVSVGRLIRGKRVDLLIEAMHILKHKFPNINAVVVGEGPEKERLMKHAKAAGVDIDFIGRVESSDDVIRYTKSAKVAVHFSCQEGGSSVVLHEFNASGLPVIAILHPLGIDKRLLIDNENGYIARDFNDAVSKIKFLLSNKDLCVRMKSKCMLMAKEHDWSRVFRKYEEVVNNV